MSEPIISTANRLGAVEEYYFSRKLKEIAAMRESGINVLNLGIGSPDLSPSIEVLNTLIEESKKDGNHGYQSYAGLLHLREAFAQWYQNHFQVTLNANTEVMPLIGSKEGIMHISMTYLNEGDEVLVPNPGYPTYSAATKLAGGKIIPYELSATNNWLPDLEKLAQRDLTKVKIMWVNYPHMPTGANANFSFFEKLIAFAKKHAILIVNDNPYSFILNDNPLSLLSIDGAKGVALELNSLSKSHNMAGWRVGVLAGNPIYLQNILRFKSNMDSGMFKPLQLAAVKALTSTQNWYADLNIVYKKRRAKVFELLNLLKCEYTEDKTGMFVWAKIPRHFEDGFAVSDLVLKNAHVFITPGGIFGSQGKRYIRISLCSKIEVFEEAIERISNLE